MYKTKFSSSGGQFGSGFTIDSVLKGEDGFSPIVEIEEIENGHRMSITDADSTKSIEILNGQDGATGPIGPIGPVGPRGQDGKDGKDGKDGEDGLTPHIGQNGTWWVGDTDTGIYVSANTIDVVELPTQNIDSRANYRLLKGTLYFEDERREDCICNIVKWGTNNQNRPASGEGLILGTLTSSLTQSSFRVYYNLDSEDLYGYVDDVSLQEINNYIDSAYDTMIAKLIKGLILVELASSRWVSLSQLLGSTLGNYAKFYWGGLIQDPITPERSTLYLMPHNEFYQYHEGVWVTREQSPIRRGIKPWSLEFGSLTNHANGLAAIAMGMNAIADGDYGVAIGPNIYAPDGMIAFGCWNEGIPSHILEIGCGTEKERKNLLYVTDSQECYFNLPVSFNKRATFINGVSVTGSLSVNGPLLLQGSVSVIGDLTINGATAFTKEEFKTSYITSGAAPFSSTPTLTRYGYKTTVEGANNTIFELLSDYVRYCHIEGLGNTIQTSLAGSVIDCAHIEGWLNKSYASHSHIEGVSNTVGSEAIAAHVEGINVTVNGIYSHGEGNTVTVNGLFSHGEGFNVVVNSAGAHGEGVATIVSGAFQHVQGVANVEDVNSDYLHIVGNGELNDDATPKTPHNAHTIDWSGNAWFCGDVKIGGDSYNDETAKTLATEEFVINYLDEIFLNGAW